MNIKKVMIDTKFTCRKSIRTTSLKECYVSGRVFLRTVYFLGIKVREYYDYQVVLPTYAIGCSEEEFNEAVNAVAELCEDKVKEYSR